MSIRLSKIAKELNVGISTVVDFLDKKGHSIPNDPNHKISDDEEDMLYQEFSKDKKMRIDSERVSQQRQIKEKKESVSIEGFDSPKKKEEEIKTVIPEGQMPKIKPVGKINLDNLYNNSKKEEAKNEKPKEVEVTATPVEKTPVVPEEEQKKQEVKVEVSVGDEGGENRRS